MANQDHLKILHQGVKAWNDWRSANADIRPDLSGADLSDAKLSEAVLVDAGLRDADLSGADLSGADLRDAVLFGADLFGADLFGADLFGADLRGANLCDTALDGANFTHANLESAVLDRAARANPTITEAMLQKAQLIDLDEPEEVAEQMELTLSPGSNLPGNTAAPARDRETPDVPEPNSDPRPLRVSDEDRELFGKTRYAAKNVNEKKELSAERLKELKDTLGRLTSDSNPAPGNYDPVPLEQETIDDLSAIVNAQLALVAAPNIHKPAADALRLLTTLLEQAQEKLGKLMNGVVYLTGLFEMLIDVIAALKELLVVLGVG